MKQIKFAAAILALVLVATSAFTNKKAFTARQYGLQSKIINGSNITYTFADKALVAQNANLTQSCISSGNGCTYTLDFDAISGETVSNLVVGSETVVNGKVTITTTTNFTPDSDGDQAKQYNVTD